MSLMFCIGICEHTCTSHVSGIYLPVNGSIMLHSVCGCNEHAYQQRGDIISRDGSFICDAVSSICFNSRDSLLVDSRQILDDLIVEVR